MVNNERKIDTMNISPCGIDCDVCPLMEKCGNACQVSGGKPFYIKDFDVEVCPIYDCSVNKNGFKTCAECSKLPCEHFYEWRDPSMSQEEHNKGIEENVARLKAGAPG